MDKIEIEGGIPLVGEIPISGSKNSVLPILTACLLTAGSCKISNVPDLVDIRTTCLLLEVFGASVDHDNSSTYTIDCSKLTSFEAPYNLVKTMRASCLTLGPLVARSGKAKVSLPGGCAIGERPIDQHLKGLKALGAEINLSHGYVEIEAKRGLTGGQVSFDLTTVTGTMNIMMVATLAKGETVIKNCALEPEVEALAKFLNKMGAKIEGAGTNIIHIQGVNSLFPAETSIIPDRIETGTYMVAAAITSGDLSLTGANVKHVNEISDCLIKCGCQLDVKVGRIRIIGQDEIRSTNIVTSPYPGFPTDMQAQMMTLMTLAQGTSVIKETIFENRFMHVAELRRMGANILISGNSATVHGVNHLSGAQVMATDLRASASLILAGLATRGVTTVSRVYHLDRGYENLVRKLRAVGAKIKRVSSP